METTAKDRYVRLTILIGGTLFILAMAYGSGMRAQVKHIRQIDQTRKLAEQNYRDAQRKLRLRLTVIEQLEARRQVAQAMDELDKRNFGTAGEHVKTAVQLLEAVQKANTNSPDLQANLNALQHLSLSGSINVGADHDKLQEIATQMDAVLGKFTTTFIQESAADDAAHPIVAPTMNDVPLPPGNHIKDTQD